MEQIYSFQEIFRWFKLYFPLYGEDDRVESWIPYGENQIRITQIHGQQFIFTFYDHDNWRFETIKSFGP